MKTQRNLKLLELYFKAMWIVTLGVYALIPSGTGLVSWLYYAYHILTIAAFVIVLRMSDGMTPFNTGRLVAMAGSVVVILCSGMYTTTPVTFNSQIIASFAYMEMFMAVFIMDFLRYTKELERFVYRINISISFIFIYLYFSPHAYDGKIAGALYLGYSNPNVTAIFLLLNLAFLAIYFEKEQKPIIKFLIFAIGAFLIYLIYETDSRTCIIAALAIVVYRFFVPKWHLPKWMILLFELLPLFFVFFYMNMYLQGTYSGETFMDKEFFSGRESFYVEKMEELREILFVGDFGEYKWENAHNGPLTILLNAGILGYVLHFWFTTQTMLHYHARMKTYRQTMALIVLFVIFVHASAEAPLYVSGSQYSILLATVYWIFKGEEETTDHETSS